MAADTIASGSGTGKLNKGRKQFLGSELIPHLLNHVFIGLDGTFHVNNFVELPREWPVTAGCKNEMGVVELLEVQKVEQDVRPFQNRA